MADNAKGVIAKAEGAIKNVAGKVEAEVEKIAAEVKAEAIKFVRMFRDPAVYDAPHTAEVHPDEVENYRPGGWITEDEAKAAAAAREAAAKAAEAPAAEAPKA